MNQGEFYQALYGAPTLVKGRGMNHHIKLLWNAIDRYLCANPVQLESLSWLVKWRDDHAPTGSRVYWIKKLDNYIENLSKRDTAYRNKFFCWDIAVGFDKATKLHAARELKKKIQGERIEPFSEDENAALHEGNLGKLVAEFEANGLLEVERKENPYSNVPSHGW